MGNHLALLFKKDVYKCDQNQKRQGFQTVCIKSYDQMITRMRVDDAVAYFNRPVSSDLPSLQSMTAVTDWIRREGMLNRDYYIELNDAYELEPSAPASKPYYVQYGIDANTLYIDVTRP